ncbi:DUF2079 domain-containing protein [Candidatus Gottesmanbacteria bacterium]|nr:DUF2079 domain-containing protein [Candidatus Gottesmanbacteria bacterium]
MERIRNFPRDIGAVFALLLLVWGIFSIISIQTHNHFQTFGWDLGFFDQIIWKVSRGDLIAYSTIAHENLLADHFQPVLYFLAPLYMIKTDVRMILIGQAFIVVMAALPLYLLTKKTTKSLFFSFSICMSYLLFIGTQWTILNEFHQMAFAPLFLALFFYSLETRRTIMYWVSLGGLIGTKEELGLLVVPLGLVVWLFYKKKRLGLVTMAIGLLSFFTLIYIIMPFFSVRGIYSHNDFGVAGYTVSDVLKKSISDPLFFIRSMIIPEVKLRTVISSLFSYGFLPLFSPIHMIPIIGHFASRFIYAGPQFTKWVNVNHHAAPLGILLSIASVYSISKYSDLISRRIKLGRKNVFVLFGVYVIFFALAQDVYFRGPIHSIAKMQLYENQSWMSDIEEVLKKIPHDAPVSSQNNLVPHISQRDNISLLPEIRNASYIAIDMHESPNAFSPLTKNQMKVCFEDLLLNKKFSVIVQKGEAYLLKRNEDVKETNNELQECKYEI